jgi:CxxC-x17-CxxC domain-containing protein
LVTPIKVMYPTICDTCGTDIEVPFKPDGKRPTFCRDCLRDYQRATARVRESVDRKNRTASELIERGMQASPVQKKVESVAFVSSEQPMTLSQVTNMQPRKLKTLRSRPVVNLQDVRSMIQDMRESGAGSRSDEE